MLTIVSPLSQLNAAHLELLLSYPTIFERVESLLCKESIPNILPSAIFIVGDGDIKQHLTFQPQYARYYVNYTPNRRDVPYRITEIWFDYEDDRYLAILCVDDLEVLNLIPPSLWSKLKPFLST